MAYTTKITRHEIKRNKGIIVSAVIGITVTDNVSGHSRYIDKVWTVGTGGDFATTPTRAEFRAAVKSWLTTIPIDPIENTVGTSILQGMKDSIQARVDETTTVFKSGDAGSMVNETM